MTDDGGVLGKLPDSRPGRRSEKRPAKPRVASKPSPEAAERPEPQAHTDPVGDTIRAATGIAAAGARAANGVAREVLRRIPRP